MICYPHERELLGVPEVYLVASDIVIETVAVGTKALRTGRAGCHGELRRERRLHEQDK